VIKKGSTIERTLDSGTEFQRENPDRGKSQTEEKKIRAEKREK